jgi:hypothetical protein
MAYNKRKAKSKPRSPKPKVVKEKPLFHAVHPEELLPDGDLILSFTIPGQPATKKTSQRIFRGVIMPSVQYCKYEQYCEEFCKNAWINTGKEPIDFGVSMNMRVYLKNWIVGDCTGYQQSIADILQKFGVLANDSWLHWDWQGNHWFGGVDSENPRVEIELRRFRHPKEEYRVKQEIENKQKLERKLAREEKAKANLENNNE